MYFHTPLPENNWTRFWRRVSAAFTLLAVVLLVATTLGAPVWALIHHVTH